VVEESDGDLMGDGVNIAARLEGVASPGAICLSEQAYWQVKGRLDLKVTDLGATQLKNIAEPVHVYSLEVGQPSQAKAIKSAVPKRRSLLVTLAAALAALLIVIAGGAWWFLDANRPASVATKAPAEAARLSVVVLPFANLSGDPAQDYLADALTDELTTALARIPGAFVIARNTAFTYRGKPVDAKAIGKELGVRYVLEGSVQPSATQLRVNAQLIDADSGAHLWADQFDTARADLLQTQDEIVARLARALDVQLVQVEAARLKRTPPANPDAEDLALQCVSAVIRGGVRGKGAEAGFPLCERALALDPNNVRALILLSVKHRLAIGLPERDLKRADEFVSRALALDPNSAFAHAEKAGVLVDQERPEEAISEAERALSLDPTMALADLQMGGASMALGVGAQAQDEREADRRFDEALEFFDKAIRLSPHDPALNDMYMGKAWAYNESGHYDQAIEWGRRAIASNPSSNGYEMLGRAYLSKGEFEKALEFYDKAILLEPNSPYINYYCGGRARALFGLKRYDEGLEDCPSRVTNSDRKER
jgi:TolB-like protein/Tfp pilus assembly protein PilF